MRTLTVTLEIKIDEENIKDYYPAFDESFESVEDFIESIYDSITTDSPESLATLGYSVEIRDNSLSPEDFDYFSLN